MILFNIKKWYTLLLFIINITHIHAKRSLSATSLVTCMENSKISSNSFDVIFNPDDRSLHYTLDLTTQLTGYINADILVYAYGFRIINQHIDFCNLEWKQFCPLYPGDVKINSIEIIAKKYTDMIPGIAYQVPDIDTYARVKLYNNDSDYLACLQIYFSNGKTVSQTGVKWATAIVAGIGLLLSAVLSTFGNSTAASHISANTMSLFLYFQSVVVVSMQHVHSVPPIAAAWSENLAWSMGLIRVSFMQRIFRWYVESTGGTPALYLTSTTISVLTQRSVDYVKKRAVNVLYGNNNTLIFRGIRRLAFRINMENTSVVCTGFTFFVLCGYVLAGFIMCCKYSFELMIRNGWVSNDKFVAFRQNWRVILKGSLLRYIYIGFTQLTILSFWEFTEHDSAAVIVIAALFLVLSLGIMGWSSYRTVYFAKKSIELHNNPAALLYGDEEILNKYGFLYTMFNAKHYWWNCVILSYIIFKSLFIGFAQGSGKTQVLALFIIDLFYFIAIIHYKPYLDKPTNVINILISTVTLVNSFLFMFFSDLFGQPYKVSAIMGWIFFIMNAAFSFVLLLMILTFAGMIIFSKNPDLRFKPAKDDRTSFQRFTKTSDGFFGKNNHNNELMALGDVAKDHNENWEYDLQHPINHNENENIFASSDDVIDEKRNTLSTKESGLSNTFSNKIFRSLSLKKLTKKNSIESENLSNNNIIKNNNNISTPDINRRSQNSNSTDSTSPVRRTYPGHTRQVSDSQNALISSYDNDGRDFHLAEPNIFDSNPNSNSNLASGSSLVSSQRNSSTNSNTDPMRSTDIFNSKYI